MNMLNNVDMKMILLLVVAVAVIYMLHQQSQNCNKCVAPVNEGFRKCVNKNSKIKDGMAYERAKG